MRIGNWLKENYILAIIIIAAAILRFYHADFQSLWADEILSMTDANPNLTMKQFYDGIMFWEFIPHFFFLLLRFVFEIFGYTTGVGRAFSAVIGVVGVYAIYLLGKELFGKRGGLIAAALLSVNFFHISYSQEIRPYGMLFVFTVLAFYRLAIFIRKPTLRNAIYYGIFAGLILNSHFFGFITLFSQYLLLLFFLILCPKENRLKFFLNAFVAGLVTLAFVYPIYDLLTRVNDISSFWLQKPGPEAFTNMFKEFFGNSEMVLYVLNFAVLYYGIKVFSSKLANYKYETITQHRTVFGFIVLFLWFTASLLIPLIKSYLDVPMILGRYFISILAILVLVIASGLNFIKNNVVRNLVVAYLVLFSLIDLFIVKNYYNTPTKSQWRELTQEIINRNPRKSKVIAYWSWLYPFYLDQAGIKVEGGTLEDYVIKLKSGAVPPKAFWYADANSRPFALSPDDQAYLAQNFDLREQLSYLDSWAHYYVPKGGEVADGSDGLNVNMFSPANFDGNGNMILFENVNAKTDFFVLEKGNYELVVKANSLPEKPVNGENAHFKIKLNGLEIANYNLSENPKTPERVFAFSYDKAEKARFQLIYDNDIIANGQDRNAIVYSISIRKK